MTELFIFRVLFLQVNLVCNSGMTDSMGRVCPLGSRLNFPIEFPDGLGLGG